MTAPMFLCPGRGSYGRKELGWLSARLAEGGDEVHDLVARLEDLRRAMDPSLPSLLDLDRASEFRPALHLPGRNASPLIFACTLVDHMRAAGAAEPALVGGNSLGFYTALVVSGSLDFEAGYRLVATMARLQEEGTEGGQILWTLLDDEWNVLAERVAVMRDVLQRIASRGADHAVDVSIRLGGHVVLAGTEAGVRDLLRELPRVHLGKREFPFRLPFHGPFHTPLLESVAQAAKRELAGLPFARPRVPLIDGRGFVWSPMSTDVEALAEYTLHTQVTTTFDFTSLVRCALLEFAPDAIELLAPGSSLRAPVGHVERALGVQTMTE